MHKGSFWAAVAVLALLAPQVRGHGIWLAERSGALAMIYGHGAEDLDTVKRFDLVKAVSAYDADQSPVPASLVKTDRLVLVEAGKTAAVVALTLDNGHWTKGADGKWVKKGRDEVPGATESGRYVKYALRMQGTTRAPLAPLKEHALQILPVRGKLPEHMGEAIALRVLFEGKPAVGAKVTRDYVNDPDAKPIVVGKDGIVTLRVRNQGLNVIAAAFDGPPDDPAKAAKTGYFASLSFVLKHAPE